MTGSIYAHHPEILMHSFSQMNEGYKRSKSGKSTVLLELQKIYISIFGIPEIGFQVRSQYFRQALRYITTNITPTAILDVGSGIGCYVFELAKLFPESFVDGWEIDRKKLEFTKKFRKELPYPNTSFSFGDITKSTKIRNHYDILINVDVLEHIVDYQKALKNMYTLLKPGGYVFLHTPQENQKRIFRMFEKWEHEDHVREGFNANSLRKDMEKIGFRDIKIRNSFGFFGSLAWELNHLLLSKSFVLAGIVYPFLFVLSQLDGFMMNTRGLCLSVVARKES